MEEVLLVVKPQESLPKVGQVMKLQKMISGSLCDFKVKKISDLEWNKYNSLIVIIQGTYVLRKSQS